MYQASAPRFAAMLRNLSAAITTFRLYPDMFPFTRQVQVACDTAKGAVARLAGVDNFIESMKAEKIDGERRFEGMPYLLAFAYPNFYFHITTAYNILRHNGVELGKLDFLGKT